jgi:tRNA (adenine57-N1/adenine58-N1)-methyltransferase catalytic subunit
MKLVSQASITLSGPRRFSISLYSEITMYETLVRPIEVFQIPPLQPISIVSEKLKKSELKREDKRLRQIAANKAAAAASAKRKRDTVAADGSVDESLNAATESPHGAGQTGRTSKRVKTEEDDGVPQMEEQDINMDVNMEVTLIGGPSTSAFPLVKAVDPTTTTSLSLSTTDVVADIQVSTATSPPAKINVSKALPEVRGHTSYLTFACLIPIPGFSAAPPEAPTDERSSEQNRA